MTPKILVFCFCLLISSFAQMQDQNTSELLLLSRESKWDQLLRLLDKGANPNISDPVAGSPLHFAVKAGRSDVVKALVAAGADTNSTDFFGWTPMLLAISEGHFEILKFLENQGAPLRQKDGDGITGIMWAAMNRNPEILRYLLKKGLSPLDTDNLGRTAFDMVKNAEIEGAEEIRDILRGYGATDETPVIKGLNQKEQKSFAHHFELGMRAMKSGNKAQATDAFAKAQEIAGGACSICDIYATQTSASGRLKLYGLDEEGIQQRISSANGSLELAQTYLDLGIDTGLAAGGHPSLLKQAETWFIKAIETDARVTQAFLELAHVNEAMGKVSDADAYYQNFLGSLSDPKAREDAETNYLMFRWRTGLGTKLPYYDPQAKMLDLAEFKGKVVLLDFWATWCKPCLLSESFLEELVKKFEGKPFQLIGISVDRDPKAWFSHIKKKGNLYPQFFDYAGHKARSMFQIESYPTFIILGPDGKELWRTNGWGDRVSAEMKLQLKQALRKIKRGHD